MGKLFGTLIGNQHEEQRNEILETLLRKIADLEDENAMLRLDLNRAIGYRDEYMADANRDAAEITQLQADIMTLLGKMRMEKPQRPIKEDELFLNNTPFVVVLIAGTESMLEIEHIQQGNEGGRKAAKRFYEHLMQYLRARKVFQTHWRLVIKFYASMSSLGTTYLKTNTIEKLETWREFIVGFNQEYPLCYFIDSGDDQIKAEGKIQDELTSFFGHRKCKHTVLVVSPDGGYTGFIRQYVKTDNICGRMTVIEAVPFPGEFHDLSSRFLPPQKGSLFPQPAEYKSLTPSTSSKRAVSLPVPSSSDPKPRRVLSSVTPTPSPRKFLDSAVSRLQPLPSTISAQSKQKQIPIFKSASNSSLLQPPSTTKSTAQFNLPKTPDRNPRTGQTQTAKSSTSKYSNQSSTQMIKRKPLAETQTKLPVPRPRNTFFNSKGQRVDSRSYVNMYTQRYLEY